MKFKANKDKSLKDSMKKMESKKLQKLKKRGIIKPDTFRPYNLLEFIENAQSRGSAYDGTLNTLKSSSLSVCKENSAKLYSQEVKKVIEQSDVIIEVIDSRDPIGSRSKELESQVSEFGSSKRLVILMNKIDLVPPPVVNEWLKVLRRELPAIPFKASTQDQSKKLGRFDDFYSLGDRDLTSSKCSGADLLLRLLGNYCRCKDIKTKITVGIVGFPNTGKSSVINSLKRSVVCTVGSLAGITRSLQKVQLTKHIQLLDSPGVILKSVRDNPLKAVLANCVCSQKVNDPISVAEEILRLVPSCELFKTYGISDVTDVNQFLSELARRKGFLRQGGVANLEETAFSLLKDWNEGKIIHYVPVPEEMKRDDTSHVDSRIVTEMSKEFDIDGLCSFEDMDCEDS